MEFEGKEIKEVPGWPGYFVSRDGEVFSVNGKTKTLTKLKFNIEQSGYRVVKLYKDTIPKIFKVHALVLLVYVGPRPEGKPHIDHIDRCRTNNNLENLRYCTAKENRANWSEENNEKARERAKNIKISPEGRARFSAYMKSRPPEYWEKLRSKQRTYMASRTPEQRAKAAAAVAAATTKYSDEDCLKAMRGYKAGLGTQREMGDQVGIPAPYMCRLLSGEERPYLKARLDQEEIQRIGTHEAALRVTDEIAFGAIWACKAGISTQLQMAASLNMSNTTLSKFLTGVNRPHLLKQLLSLQVTK